MQMFGWSPLVLLFPSPPVLVPILWWQYKEHQLQVVSPSLSCSTVFPISKLGQGTYPSFRFLSILLWSAWAAKTSIPQIVFLLLIIIRSGCLAKIRWSVVILKSQSRCVSFSRTNSGLCIYYLIVWSNFNFLHNYQWITSSTQSCLVLYSFCANLLHSFIMWLIVSSLSSCKLHLLFCCVLSILCLICLVLMAFCAAIRRHSVFLLRFPFLSHVMITII